MKAPTTNPSSRNTPQPVAGNRPFQASTPQKRGDNGTGPLPRGTDGRESRHTKAGGKTGGC